MKRTAVLLASCVTLVGLALTADGALAAIALNSSRSNIYKPIDPHNPGAVKACTDSGGKVGKDPKGEDACINSGDAVPTGSDTAAPAKSNSVIEYRDGEDATRPPR